MGKVVHNRKSEIVNPPKEFLRNKIKTVIVNLSDQHSLVSNWVSELRDIDIQQDRMRFRHNLERIAEVAAYEISKVLPFIETEVKLHWEQLQVKF